jgi:sugar fermentation stimulation protein A
MVPDLIPAVFLERPNRFIVVARLRDGRHIRAHLADPGRLRELLLPGAALRLRPAGPPRKGAPARGAPAARKTRFTVALVRSPEPPRPWVSLDTNLANRLAADLFESGRVPVVGKPSAVTREVRRGASRFDFLLTRRDGTEILTEVKSVTLVENGVALFPDAPTVRGARHVRELEAHVRSGGRALVLFVAQREDARVIRPNAATDPAFAAAVESAAGAGVLFRGGGEALYQGPLRVLPALRRKCRGPSRARGSPPPARRSPPTPAPSVGPTRR